MPIRDVMRLKSNPDAHQLELMNTAKQMGNDFWNFMENYKDSIFNKSTEEMSDEEIEKFTHSKAFFPTENTVWELMLRAERIELAQQKLEEAVMWFVKAVTHPNDEE